VVLSGIAGAVDAIGYIVLGHLFTAHMSGNAVAFGTALGQAEWATALERGLTIALFAVGIAAGALAADIAISYRYKHPMVNVFAIEIALLTAFALLGRDALAGKIYLTAPGWHFFGLVSLPTLAMGMQTATIRRAGQLRIHTTYITGILTHLVETIVQTLVSSWQGRWSDPVRNFREIALYGGILVAYVTGAVAGTVAEFYGGTSALALPIAGLALVIARDLAHPHELVDHV